MQHNQSVEQSAKLHAAQVRARLFEAKKRPLALPMWQQPHWVQVATTFNHHVIAYRRWQVETAIYAEEAYVHKRTMREIAMEVLRDYPDITLEELKEDRHRARRITFPRQVVMHKIKNERPDLSYPAIGRFFGGRDHTTVLHAVRKIEALLQKQLA